MKRKTQSCAPTSARGGHVFGCIWRVVRRGSLYSYPVCSRGGMETPHHTAFPRPRGWCVERVGSPSPHRCYRTTRGTEPTLDSIPWGYGTHVGRCSCGGGVEGGGARQRGRRAPGIC